MKLVSRPWLAVGAGRVIVGPSGQVWLVERVNPGPAGMLVQLADPEESWPEPPRRSIILVHVTDPVNVLESTTAGALAVLRRHFPLAEQIG